MVEAQVVHEGLSRMMVEYNHSNMIAKYLLGEP